MQQERELPSNAQYGPRCTYIRGNIRIATLHSTQQKDMYVYIYEDTYAHSHIALPV